ncbi:MAG TPA: trypsin-like peptidase domain-containing protein [Usitatibacter sp.]|nr:trypsin-like peptidase domain-containing protein [Usitatibacter sp.]
MIRQIFACAALAAAFFASAQAATLPRIVALPSMEASSVSQGESSGRLKVGSVRALAKAAAMPQWTPYGEGFISRASASSAGALGLRVRLDLGVVPGTMEVRVRGEGDRVESMLLDPVNGPEAWTPWTEGESQEIEIYSAVAPGEHAVSVGAVVHFTASPLAKAAGSCTVSTSCSTNSAVLDAAMAQAKKAVMKITFIEDGGSFLCSATLIQTERSPAPYVLTANHCIDNAATAQSVTSIWFYESLGCGTGGVNPGWVQQASGMQLVLGNMNVDSTLLLMNGSPPPGAAYVPWTRERLASNAPIVSLSHPQGDTSRFALGTINQEYRLVGRPQDVYGVKFTRGIIEGGSSGSGLFVLTPSNTLQLAGILSGTTVRHSGGMSCTNLEEEALYSRFDIFEPQIDQYIRTAAQAADDAPNRVQDWAGTAAGFAGVDGTPLNLRTTALALDNRRIDYAGDLDVYRFTLTAPAVVTAWTEGANLDTVGAILDSRGVSLENNDDVRVADNHFGITRSLEAGTYYVQVAHFEPAGTGSYNLRVKADLLGTNYTDLWSTATESGWGLNLNHQGNVIFGSLFTYDAAGIPMWLVMSEGTRQSDGSYQGTLYRGTGPAFNTVPWHAATLVGVGTMRLVFSGADAGTLTYTFNGTSVTKSITRFTYAKRPSCTWSAFDRSFADNYQDLWWNPAEQGWGVNIAHQDDILFASLYTYDAAGRGLWLVMSSGHKTGEGQYSGTLYRTTGPAFNASPWVDAVNVAVGTMSFAFTNGNAGTLTYTFNGVTVTKQIERFVFAPMKVQCES